MHLETFNEQTSKRVDKETGYKAYVTSEATENDGVDGEGRHNNDYILITTTRMAANSEGEEKKRSATLRFGDWRDPETVWRA